MKNFLSVLLVFPLLATADGFFHQIDSQRQKQDSGNDAEQTDVSSMVDTIQTYKKDLKDELQGKVNGLAIVNGKSRNWERIAKTSKAVYDFNSGEDFLDNLHIYTESYGCIPKLTIGSQGWKESFTGGGQGIPVIGHDNGAGLYKDETSMKQFGSSAKGRSLDDLQKLLKPQGKFFGNKKPANVKFCDHCIVQMFGSNVADTFAAKFSAISGCQVVYATGKVSSAKSPHWKSEGLAHNERNGGFKRITPIKDANGKVTHFINQSLGKNYEAL